MEKKKTETPVGQQMDLIDVSPESMKDIIPIARLYNAAKYKRIAAGNDEVKYKREIKELADKAVLRRLDDGSIRFAGEGVLIEIIPRDDLIKVTEKTDK